MTYNVDWTALSCLTRLTGRALSWLTRLAGRILTWLSRLTVCILTWLTRLTGRILTWLKRLTGRQKSMTYLLLLQYTRSDATCLPHLHGVTFCLFKNCDTDKEREHIKLVLKNLHWLPVKDGIHHKILSLAYNCFGGTAHQYLQELIPRYHHHHQSLNREGRWGTNDDLQPVFSIFPCSPLSSGTCRTPGLSIPWCCLPTSSFVRLVFFLLSLCLARWFWPDLMNGKHSHTTAVCVFLRSSGDLHVVQLPAGSWHGLPRL